MTIKHDSRLYETELGDIVSDIFKDLYDVDMVILQSGSHRAPECPKELYNADLRKLLSLSTYYDLARWFLSQKEPVKAPEKNRFEILNFEMK